MNGLTRTSDLTVPTPVGEVHVELAGGGPPAVLWHSLFVDSTSWLRLRAPLGAQRRLVLVDGPNHGGRPPTRTPLSLEACAAAAVDILDHVGIEEPVDWLGNAWGGHVGVRFAAAYPDRCRSLIAIGAPIHALSGAHRRRTRLLSTLYLLLGARPVVNPLVDALLCTHARVQDADAAAIVGEAFRRADRRGMYDAIRWLSLNRRDLTAVLDQLVTPTLLTTGLNDPMWTVESARTAVTQLRNGALAILPGAGHVGPLLQAVPEVNELVTAFWTDPSGTVAKLRAQQDQSRPTL